MFSQRTISQSSRAQLACSKRLSAASPAEERAMFIFVLADLRGRDSMGHVALTLKIMLTGPDVDAGAVKEEIENIVHPKQITEKPVAFGLKTLEVLLVFDDREGANTDAIEEKLRSIPGVSSVEAGDITLI